MDDTVEVVLKMERKFADWIERMAILAGKSLEIFILECVSKYQNAEMEGFDVKERKANEGFDEFWKIYPRKIGVGAAKKAWARVRYQEGFINVVKAAVERAKKSQGWQDMKFIPHPATWLNQERWKDEGLVSITGRVLDPNKDVVRVERSEVDWTLHAQKAREVIERLG